MRRYAEERDEWLMERTLQAHSDWVRDVAWAPSLGSTEALIASCSQARPRRHPRALRALLHAPPHARRRLWSSALRASLATSSRDVAPARPQDKKVIIWTQDAASAGAWNQKEIQFACVVWRVSWSVTGNILAVSGGDNQVTLWKESLLGEWTQIGQLSEDGSAAGR